MAHAEPAFVAPDGTPVAVWHDITTSRIQVTTEAIEQRRRVDALAYAAAVADTPVGAGDEVREAADRLVDLILSSLTTGDA